MTRFLFGFYGERPDHSRGRRIFKAGQTISGYLDVQFSRPTKVKGIYFTFYGRGKIHWTTGAATKTRHHMATETYVEEKSVLFGIAPHEKGPNEEHPAGTHRYDFEVKVPENAPPTLTLMHGDIKYSLKVRVTSSEKLKDDTHKEEISVENVTDLLQLDNTDAAQEFTKHKYICCLCCRSGPISGFCHIDKSGYLPGDSITASAEVTNLSNRHCNSMSIRLVQEILYKAFDGAKERERDILDTVEHGSLAPGMSHHFRNVRLRIPISAMTSMKACKIMRLKHSVKLVICPQKSLDLDVPLDITIGSLSDEQIERYRTMMYEDDNGEQSEDQNTYPIHF